MSADHLTHTTITPRDVYQAYIRQSLRKGCVPDILVSFCHHALEEPTMPLHTLRVLCTKIREANEA